MESAVQPVLGSREEKKSFTRAVIRITAPIALQNLMDCAVNSADVLMLSFVSQSAMSASSLAGQVAFVLSMLFAGLSSGAAVLGSQYWGKGDLRVVERVMGLALRLALIIGMLFTLAAGLFPQLVMRIFTDDPQLLEEGIKYLRAVSPSYVLGGFATVYLAVMRSVERVKMSAAVHCSAVGLNVLLNACFIFGVGPFPKLGIVGVALATSITRAAEVAVCLIDTRFSQPIHLHARDLVQRGGQIMKDFFTISLPAAANDIIWGLAFSVYSIIFGHLSSDIVAANSVASVVRNLGYVVCMGCASSAAIIMGKAMGDNKLAEAKEYGRRFLWISVWTAAAAGVLILLLRTPAMALMHRYITLTETAYSELSTMLLITSYYIMGGSVNTMLICGIFRAGGDTRFGLICDIISMWVYAVPVGLIAAFVLKLPEMWVYFILCLDEFVKWPVVIGHFRRGKWLKNITRDDALGEKHE